MNTTSRVCLLLLGHGWTLAQFALHPSPRYNISVFRRIALTGALALAACGPKAGSVSAAEGLQAYVKALRSDDPKPLYEMLTKAQKEAISYESWVAEWKSNAAERAWQANQVSDRWTGQLQARAEVTYSDGQQVQLRQADRGWRLEQALVSRSTAPTAAIALEQLQAALARQDLPALFALMTQERRESIEQRLRDFQDGLSQQGDDGHSDFFAVGDKRYELSWRHLGVHYRLVFVLEGANWRLDELHLGPDPVAEPEEEEEPVGGVLLPTGRSSR